MGLAPSTPPPRTLYYNMLLGVKYENAFFSNTVHSNQFTQIVNFFLIFP